MQEAVKGSLGIGVEIPILDFFAEKPKELTKVFNIGVESWQRKTCKIQ